MLSAPPIGRMREFRRTAFASSTNRRKRSIHRSVGQRTEKGDGGFTLVETLIAILLITVVMAALLPMFYGTFRATVTTNARSEATSLAVEASEQVRSFPYYEVGYYSTDQPAACGTASLLSQVTIDPTIVTTDDLQHLATSTTVDHTVYTLQRCVYWIGSTIATPTSPTNTPGAYKEIVVTVYWPGQGTTLSVSQTSSLYPGGQGSYQADDNFYPGSNATGCTSGTVPGIPNLTSVTDDGTAPSNTIDVQWTASNPPADYYVVIYTSDSGGAPPGNEPIYQAYPDYTISPETTATQQDITVGASTQYWVQVQAVYCGTPSGVSNTGTATTTASTGTSSSSGASSSSSSSTSSSSSSSSSTSTSTTSTTVATCNLYNLSAVPTGASGSVNYVAVTVPKNGANAMTDYSQNQFTLTLSSANTAICRNVYVAYDPVQGGTPANCQTYNGNGNGNGQCRTDWAELTASGTGTFTGTANLATSYDQSNGWTTTNLQFVVYIGDPPSATAYTPQAAFNVVTCSYNGNTCK